MLRRTPKVSPAPRLWRSRRPSAVGTYYVVVEAISGDYAPAKTSAKFTIEGQNLNSVTAWEGNTEVSLSDAAEYDAEAVDLTFKQGSTALIEGVDYSVKYYKSGEDANNPSNGTESAPTDAGSYYAHIVGMGKYEGKTADVQFKIDPCDLSDADIYVPTVIGATTPLPTAPTTVGGSETRASEVTLSYSGVVSGLGKYTATAEPATEKDPNFTIDTGSVDVYRVATEVKFTYDGEALPTEMAINPNEEKFDFKKLVVSYVDENGKEQQVDRDDSKGAGKWYWTAVDANGDPVTAGSELNTPGTYTVTFHVTPDSKNSFGGSAQIKLVVNEGTIDCDESFYVNFDGVVVSSINTTYDGTDIKSKIDYKLYDSEGKGVSKSDYTVTYKNAEGKVVNELVDAGEYTMEVSSTKFAIVNGTFDITINKAKVTGIRIATGTGNGSLQAINGRYALKYNNGVITPDWEYSTGERNSDGTLKWNKIANLGNNYAFALTLDGEQVKEIKEIGDYVATISASDAQTAKNYDFTADDYKFSVAKTLLFVDVPADAYYHDAIVQANKNNLVFGMNNSDVFAPDASISRADMTVILYRMAGGKIQGEDWVASDSDMTYLSEYSDVTDNEYYAKALVWATKTGVVSGYEDGRFGGADMVTTEQFVTMLGRYADLIGTDVSVDDVDATLAEKADGSQVSDFAAEYVAWALENGFIGRDDADIQPQGNISRGRAVTIAVRYQPTNLSTPNVSE